MEEKGFIWENCPGHQKHLSTIYTRAEGWRVRRSGGCWYVLCKEQQILQISLSSCVFSLRAESAVFQNWSKAHLERIIGKVSSRLEERGRDDGTTGIDEREEQGGGLVAPSVLKVHIMTRPYKTKMQKKWNGEGKNIMEETLRRQMNSEFHTYNYTNVNCVVH